MSSPTEEEEKIPSDFTHCVQKLLSSVSTLRKHLSQLSIQKEATGQNEELTSKLQAIKDAINSLAPAVHTAKQLASTSSIVERLSNEYSSLCNDYKKHYSLTMTETHAFTEYKQYIEHLSSWLSSTNANIHEVLQSVNKQRAQLIIKNLDELSKYKSLLERATILNRTMVADLPDEQATKMTNEIADVKEQWRILIEGLNTLKERHASRYTSPERTRDEDRLAQQNENLLHYIESWFTLAKELVCQHEQLMTDNYKMIDDEKTIHGSMITSANNSTNPNLLYQLKECEQELTRLKILLDENCRMLNNENMKTGEVTRSLADELTEIAKCVTKARIQLENRIEQQRGFVVELDSLIYWLKNFINESKNLDNQTIKLALNERQQYFDELIKCNQLDNHEVKDKLNNLIQMWNQLTSLITDSSTIVTTQSSSSSDKEHQDKLIEDAKNLLHTIVQLGNRQEIEHLLHQTKLFLTNIDVNISNDQSQISSHLKFHLPDQLYNDLTTRQSILKQMLIDTTHIDNLRVNFISNFNTNNNTIISTNQINDLIENYPKEMTSQIRQWLTEQQTNRIIAPLATIDSLKSIDNFDEYIRDLEENIISYEQNEPNEIKLKKILQQIDERPDLPQNFNNDDKERIENLQQRFLHIQKQAENIRNNSNLLTTINTEHIIEKIDLLIKHLREIEEQIRVNAIQPINDYERLIPDCQRIITELDQNLRINVEQIINTGKRLYTNDNKDSSGVESADEFGGTGGFSSSSPSPPLKRHSDLTLRKVRRHVLQLTQRWKSANTNIRHRLKILQRAQTTVEELRRKCDQLYSHLLEIEFAHAHQPQIRTINSEQLPIEIEKTKHLLSTLMSCKTSIDDIQQLSQTIENEYDIHTNNRTQELTQRWEHSIQSVSQRVQVLQDSIRNSDGDVYSNSVEYPWQRSVAFNKVPYFINHSDQSTSWDHPKMLELMRSLANFNDIRFSAYRTAMKLRNLQKRLCLDLTSLSDIISVFEEHQTIISSNKNIDKYIDITEIVYYLQSIFEKTSNEYPQLINVILTIDLTLNWLLNIYDINRSGSIRLLAMKMALALLCRGNIEEKYRYIFSLVAYSSSGIDVVDRQHLSILFQHAIVIPKQLGEVAAFGGSSVEPSVQSCFDYAHNPDVITAEHFLEWVKLEPQSLVWLPVMHRLAASEAAKHEARCNICKIYPILGFRYRSLKYFNCDICQNCFFSGKQTKFFKMDDPLQEYYTETTSSEDIRDFFRIFKNKFWTKHRKYPKLGYLPLPHVFDNNISSTSQQQTSSSSPPILIPILTNSYKSDVQPRSSSAIESTDEHGIIAQHCRNLNSFVHTSPRTAAHDILTRSRSLDNEQRNELEGIIHDLEEENRLLQNEYENLCQQHMEKSLIINDQQYFHSSDNQLGSSTIINEYNSSDREMLREAKQLRHHKTKLEQRMKILEEHNKQLEKQLKRSKQLLFRESPSLHHHTSNSSIIENRSTSSPLHSSTLGLRRSMERNLERQPNLITIDNLFHMADDINRAVGDLVSVITEPQSNGSSAYYQPIDTAIVT